MYPTEKDNIIRWDGKQDGFYEVWFTIVHHPETGVGFWFRHTFHLPAKGQGQPEATLWFAACDPRPEKANVAFKQVFPLSELSYDRDRLRVTVGTSTLTHESAQGALEGNGHKAAWDLKIGPGDRTFQHIHTLLRPLAKTKVCCPKMNVPYTGTITLDGETFTFDKAPGHQTHLWGTKRTEEMLWAHCNTFENAPGAALEMVAVKLRKLGRVTPWLTLIGFRDQHIELTMTSPLHVLRNQTEARLGRWEFTSAGRFQRVRGVVEVDPARLGAVLYTDPDGEQAWCNFSELADCTLTLEEIDANNSHWHVVREYRSKARACVEFQARQPAPDIPVVM
jgi:hypothetical protein